MRTAIIALAVLVGILGGFYGGYTVGHSNVTAATSSSGTSGQRTTGGAFVPGRGANAAVCPTPGSTPAAGTTALFRGTVTNLTATSMTVSNASCSLTITFGPSTTIQKQVTGSTADLSNNETVTVTGRRSSDGSVSAVTIQITPAGSFTQPGSSPAPGG
jgi:hypothetical protein